MNQYLFLLLEESENLTYTLFSISFDIKFNSDNILFLVVGLNYGSIISFCVLI